MFKALLAVGVATIMCVVLDQSGPAGATATECRTVKVVDPSPTSHSVVLSACDKLRVSISYGTQGQFVPEYSIGRAPSAKVLKLVHEGETGSYEEPSDYWTYQAVENGKTSFTVREFIPDGIGYDGTYTFKVRVTASRGATGPTGSTGSTGAASASGVTRASTKASCLRFPCVVSSIAVPPLVNSTQRPGAEA